MSRLRQLRLEANLTQRELAEKADVSERTIIGIEQGQTVPSLETLIRLRKVLGDRVVYLLDDITLKPTTRGRPKSPKRDNKQEGRGKSGGLV